MEFLKNFIEKCDAEIKQNGWDKITSQMHSDLILATEVCNGGSTTDIESHDIQHYLKNRIEEHIKKI